jgi:hypothetical protein
VLGVRYDSWVNKQPCLIKSQCCSYLAILKSKLLGHAPRDTSVEDTYEDFCDGSLRLIPCSQTIEILYRSN